MPRLHNFQASFMKYKIAAKKAIRNVTIHTFYYTSGQTTIIMTTHFYYATLAIYKLKH